MIEAEGRRRAQKLKQHKPAAKRLEFLLAACEIGQRKLRRLQWLDEPRLNLHGQRLQAGGAPAFANAAGAAQRKVSPRTDSNPPQSRCDCSLADFRIPVPGHWAIGPSRDRSFRCPTPKNNSLECCERKPDPACRYFVWRSSPASTVIAVPIASRLLLCPRRRKEIEWPISFIALCRIRNCGAFRFLRMTSSRPS